MRFYLIDRITKMEIGKSIEGIKCWSNDNDVFVDHFPGFPIVPGVLATESMAQVLGTLIEKTHLEKFGEEKASYAVLSIIHKAKFKGFLIPGDRAILKGELQSIDLRNASGSVEMFIDDNLIAKAGFSFGLIEKSAIPSDRLGVMRDEFYNIIFNGEKLRHRAKNVK